jgi:hypothetical protein
MNLLDLHVYQTPYPVPIDLLICATSLTAIHSTSSVISAVVDLNGKIQPVKSSLAMMFMTWTCHYVQCEKCNPSTTMLRAEVHLPH